MNGSSAHLNQNTKTGKKYLHSKPQHHSEWGKKAGTRQARHQSMCLTS